MNVDVLNFNRGALTGELTAEAQVLVNPSGAKDAVGGTKDNWSPTGVKYPCQVRDKSDASTSETAERPTIRGNYVVDLPWDAVIDPTKNRLRIGEFDYAINGTNGDVTERYLLHCFCDRKS